MTNDWAQFLYEVYKDNRNSPHWDGLKALHDAEDNSYFQMLEQTGVEVNPWPKFDVNPRLRKWAKKRVMTRPY